MQIMLLRTLAGLLGLIGFVQFANGQTQQTNCAPQGYVIGYFNGINTTRLQASKPINLLKEIYGSHYRQQPINYQPFYNPTEKFLQDVAETFKQLETENPELRGRWELIWEIIRGGTALTTRVLATNPGLAPVLIILKDDVIQLMQSHTEELIESALPEPVVQDHVRTMKGIIGAQGAGKKVLAIAHSQGNLFVNAVYDRVRPTVSTESLKVVHVAPPTETSRGPYVTVDVDQVINLVRLVVPNILGPNKNLPSAARYIGWGHSFELIYMNPSFGARKLVKGNIDTQFAALEDPPCFTPLSQSTRFIHYLPAALSGVRAQQNNCRRLDNSAMFGTMTFTPSGTVVGSGCFESIDFPPSTRYSFTQEPDGFDLYLNAGGRKEFILSLHTHMAKPIVQVESPAVPFKRSFDTALSGALPIDARARMLGWVSSVTYQPCTARIRQEPSWHGDLPADTKEGAHIELSGAAINVKRGAEIIASVKISDLLAGNLYFSETHLPGHSAGSHRIGIPHSNLVVGFFDDADDGRTRFQFNASLPPPSKKARAEISCVSP